MAIDPAYAAFFFNSLSSVVLLETIEISHPSFAQVHRAVRNASKGLTATLETAATVEFLYYPMEINMGELRNNLDQSLTVAFGDLGDVLHDELDEVSDDDTYSTKPVLIYRTYRSDDLSEPIEVLTLEIFSTAFNKDKVLLEAGAPRVNIHKTGLIQSFDNYPTLRGGI